MYATSKTNQAINLALFDFDGTLYPKDSFTGFIFFALSKRHIIKKGLQILPWIQAYYLSLYPAHAMRPRLFQSMFKDVPAPDLEKLAQQYAKKLIKNLDPNLLKQLKQHQQCGDQVVLVSASIDVYLTYICQYLNIELICTQTEIKHGVMTGNYTSNDCSGTQKKKRVLQQYPLDHYQAIYAYGNSEEDLEMLSLADYPYMMGKNQSLPQILDIKKLA